MMDPSVWLVHCRRLIAVPGPPQLTEHGQWIQSDHTGKKIIIFFNKKGKKDENYQSLQSMSTLYHRPFVCKGQAFSLCMA